MTALTNLQRANVLREALVAALDAERPTLERLCTEDLRVWTPVLSAHDLDAVVEARRQRSDAFTDLALAVVPLDVGGDCAAAEWTMTMTHSGSITVAGGTVGPTGIRVSLHGVSVAEFRGARICAVRQYFDESAVFEQLGVAPRSR